MSMSQYAHEAWSFAIAAAIIVVAIATASTVWHRVDVDQAKTEMVIRVRVVEACQAEPDTDLDECVKQQMEQVDGD